MYHIIVSRLYLQISKEQQIVTIENTYIHVLAKPSHFHPSCMFTPLKLKCPHKTVYN